MTSSPQQSTADPTRIINSPAPPLAPATIARDALRRATLRAVPLTDSLEMDGVLDEDVYETVPSFGDFIQQTPLAGEPSAWIGSIDISQKKAYTSRAFDIATKDLAEHAQSGNQFFGIHASNDGKIMIFAGGVPLKKDGEVVGAVGVSGGSGEQDHTVGNALSKCSYACWRQFCAGREAATRLGIE